MEGQKRIAFCAHDAAKQPLAAWAFANEKSLTRHHLTATGNTGRLLMEQTRLQLDCLRSGVLGGDMELGALIAEGRIDILIFFTDPVTRQPHDIDPAPLLRVAALSETVVAINEASADFIIRSELIDRLYPRPHLVKALPAATQRLDKRRDVA
ncbi:methylglyoxal synthase [Acuticoccus sp. M5D2P5]|uniref:methylglyoxal synthase n=1 Tax=Acuticoccus kalidii TaxID=2910977 RepID=UPI001F3C084B|nr:methylglyoxal synthase [Acuticoccus kalidii]MCF3935462.1 methylglyoxal synthase [Acuticoccus kalidii]